jgi:hypothetical protein
MQSGTSQSGLNDQLGVPYSAKPKTRPVNRLPDRARALNMPQFGEVPVPSSSTVGPTPSDWSEFNSQPVAGPLSTRGLSPSVTTEDVVYTDGACSRNGHTGSVAGIGVWWGPNDPRCVRRLAYGAGN